MDDEMGSDNQEGNDKAIQSALLRDSTPSVFCQYFGQAGRHINLVGDEYIIAVNQEHKVDVFRKGDPKKIKTLDIEYMRHSYQDGDLLFIGTEEKILYLVDAQSFNILDQI